MAIGLFCQKIKQAQAPHHRCLPCPPPCPLCERVLKIFHVVNFCLKHIKINVYVCVCVCVCVLKQEPLQGGRGQGGGKREREKESLGSAGSIVCEYPRDHGIVRKAPY
jgi:hypothetical protein